MSLALRAAQSAREGAAVHKAGTLSRAKVSKVSKVSKQGSAQGWAQSGFRWAGRTSTSLVSAIIPEFIGTIEPLEVGGVGRFRCRGNACQAAGAVFGLVVGRQPMTIWEMHPWMWLRHKSWCKTPVGQRQCAWQLSNLGVIRAV